MLFVIQMADVKYLHPNDATDPAFSKALREAAAAGVEVLAVDCEITADEMKIRKFVPVTLSAPPAAALAHPPKAPSPDDF